MNIRIIIKTIALLCILNLSLKAQWVHAKGPSYVKLAGLSIVNSILYAGTPDKVFKSHG